MMTQEVKATQEAVKSEEVKSLEDHFDDAALKVYYLPENTKIEDKLALYGLYKQATVGPVNTTRPGILNPKDRAKWDAWKAVEAKSKEEAMKDYIAKIKEIF